MTPMQATTRSSKHLILPLPGNDAFAHRLANECRWELGRLETRNFPDGESYVRILSDVVDKAVTLVCTLARPDEAFCASSSPLMPHGHSAQAR